LDQIFFSRGYPFCSESAPRIDHNATGSGFGGTDITYIRLHCGWLYLVAIMDWFSRYVLAWETSITMETGFCLAALEKAFVASAPGIFNTDQGAQFTSSAFTDMLKGKMIKSAQTVGDGVWTTSLPNNYGALSSMKRFTSGIINVSLKDDGELIITSISTTMRDPTSLSII